MKIFNDSSIFINFWSIKIKIIFKMSVYNPVKLLFFRFKWTQLDFALDLKWFSGFFSDFTGFYWVLLGLYQVLLGFTGF